MSVGLPGGRKSDTRITRDQLCQICGETSPLEPKTRLEWAPARVVKLIAMDEYHERHMKRQKYDQKTAREFYLYSAVFIVSLMICCMVVSGCKAHDTNTPNRAVSSPAPAPVMQHSEDVADADRRDLQLIGKKIATAILEKDPATLLSYDRDDLRVEDEASLKDKTGHLYCYLFDPSCHKDPKIASVHEILSTAQQLEVSASVAKSPDGHEYGLLLFYDKSQISEKQLHSDFLCTDEAFKRVASWHFIRIGKKWSAASPLFDLETEGACPDSD